MDNLREKASSVKLEVGLGRRRKKGRGRKERGDQGCRAGSGREGGREKGRTEDQRRDREPNPRVDGVLECEEGDIEDEEPPILDHGDLQGDEAVVSTSQRGGRRDRRGYVDEGRKREEEKKQSVPKCGYSPSR